MKNYTITYDLLKPGQDYKDLISRLTTLGAVRIELSQWLLRTTMTATQIRDDLMRFIDGNDRLFVGGLTGEAAWLNLLVSQDKVKQALAA